MKILRRAAAAALLVTTGAALAPTAEAALPVTTPADHLFDAPTVARDLPPLEALTGPKVSTPLSSVLVAVAGGTDPSEVLPDADVRDDGRIVVEVVTAGSSAAAPAILDAALAGVGERQRSAGNRHRVAVEPTALTSLAALPTVASIGRRDLLHIAERTSEGATRLGVAARHEAGVTGSVKVAVVDGGFGGWDAARAAGEVPAAAGRADFCPNTGTESTDHGTAVAEIIHDIAPDARLHLVCVEDADGLRDASQYLRANGITIANLSGGFMGTGFGNGREPTGSPFHVVEADRGAGIVWSVSAGNTGEGHWGGRFRDGDGDGLHEFGDHESNLVGIPAGGVVGVVLRWDEFDGARTDLDLLLIDEFGEVVAAGTDVQPAPGVDPVEQVFLRNGSSEARVLQVVVGRYAGSASPDLDVFVLGNVPVEQTTRNRSITEPATAPGALAVGAICVANDVPQPYSAAGPTADGRTKPDLVSFDAVSGSTYGASDATCDGGFAGTSASAPHVTGALALLKAANPGWGPAKLREHLVTNALDMGDPGADNLTGAGRMRLGQIPTTASPAGGGRGASEPEPARADTSDPNGPAYQPDGPTGTIYRLYRAYFLREPDRRGYGYWYGTYEAGYPLGAISDDFARSTEFVEAYGDLTDDEFVVRVYQNVLRREPDTKGQAYWRGQMRSGVRRGLVMLYFSDSGEFRDRTAGGGPPGYAY